MKETQLSAALVKALRLGLPRSVVFKHTDMMTSGVPDISVTWAGHTTWIEVKVCRNGKIVGRDVQSETVKRLARAGECWYVVYSESNTYVIHPDLIRSDDIATISSTNIFLRLNHSAVVEFIRYRHTQEWRKTK